MINHKNKFKVRILLTILLIFLTIPLSAQTSKTLWNGMVIQTSSIRTHLGSSHPQSATLDEDWYGGDGVITAPYGSTVTFYYDGAVESLVLMRSMEIPGGDLTAKWGERVYFYESGSIRQFTLAYDYSPFPGITAKAGKSIEFHENSAVKYFIVKYDYPLADGFVAKADTAMFMDENRNLKSFYQAKPFVAENGFIFEAGMYLVFSPEGTLTKVFHKPTSDYKNMMFGFTMKANNEATYDFTKNSVQFVPASDWTDPKDGKIYKGGVLNTMYF